MEIEHISRPAYTGLWLIFLPEPPEFTASFFRVRKHKCEKDENDIDIRYTTTILLLQLSVDTNADVVFYVNGDDVADFTGKEIVQEPELNDGSNLIE